MKYINLNAYYSFLYPNDTFIMVSNEVDELLERLRKKNHAEYERRRIHKAYFSIDANGGYEIKQNLIISSPEEIYFKHLNNRELYLAILSLPEK